MRASRPDSPRRRGAESIDVPRVLLLGSGLGLVALALVFNELLLSVFDSDPPMKPRTVEGIRASQLGFLVAGLLLVLAAECARRLPRLRSVLRKPRVTNLLLAALAAVLPLFVLELSLRPFAGPRNVVFIRDSELGWKLKPHYRGPWGGVTVTINGKGLRGPELDYAKPPDAFRILYLGDSVTFGYRLPSYEDTFPHQVEVALEKESRDRIETVNAGIGGYSPWQELIYLEREGMRYEPDLVVVSFVLNDVTEKFGLTTYGGTGEGWQLEHGAELADRLLGLKGVFYFGEKVVQRLRFGKNPSEELGRQEAMEVEWLVRFPERSDVREAWAVTLKNLGKIFTFCKERRLPALLVVFPFAFQLTEPEAMPPPQATLAAYAADHEIELIDLLPVFRGVMDANDTGPEHYFLDEDHLSAVGSEVVAAVLAQAIRERGWIARALR